MQSLVKKIIKHRQILVIKSSVSLFIIKEFSFKYLKNRLATIVLENKSKRKILKEKIKIFRSLKLQK